MTRVIGACALLLGLAATSLAQNSPFRDVILIAGQRYVRTQQVPHDYGPGISDYVVVSARDGQAAYCALYHGSLDVAYLRQFDTWGNALHDPVPFDPDSPARSWCRCASAPSGTWTFWQDSELESYGRVFDQSGNPVGATFVVAEPLSDCEPKALVVNGQVAAFLLRQLVFDSTLQFDLHMRFFDVTGAPLTDLFPVADTSESEEGGSLAFLPDGDLALGYIAGDRRTHVWHAYLRRVHPDGSVDERVLVRPGEANGTYVRLLNDGTLLVRYLPAPDGTAQVLQRFDTNFEPLADAVEIDPTLRILASTRDGRVAITTVIADRIWMQLYDVNWQPITDQFEPLGGPPPLRSFSYGGAPLAYDDNGTIWLAWTELTEDIEVAHLTTFTPFEPGDMNYDGRVDNFDITPFVMALADPAEYQAHYPGLPYEFLGDVNEDGAFDNFDISPFVRLLTGG
jgi:hypothetical protein